MTHTQGEHAQTALAHELFAAAQLAPGEGIEDAVSRITAALTAPQGVAYAELPDEHAAFETWARLRSDWRPNLERKGDGYVGAFADEAWRGWSARASHGQAPAGAAQEPTAFIHWPINGPPRLGWYSQKALNDAILKTYEGHQPDVKLYTAQVAPAAGAVAGPTVTREFTNELGNAIRITVEGPNSMHENIVTPMEAEQFRSALNEHAMRAADTTWCTYVAGMICTYLNEDADGQKAKAIAGIIERRLMFLSKSTAPMDRDTLYLLRRLLSNQFTFTSAEFRAELEKIVEGAAINHAIAAVPTPAAQADSQPAPVREESAAPKLRAMAINYPEGACWDKLDAQACMEGALEIEALRAARAQADSVLEDAALLHYALADGGNQSMNWQDVYDDWNGEGYFIDALRAAYKQDAARNQGGA